MKPILKKLLAIGRGALKGAFPGVAGAVEAVRNAKGVEIEVTTPGGETVKGIAKPHDWYSVIPSLIVSGVIIYGLFTKELDIATIIELLKHFF